MSVFNSNNIGIWSEYFSHLFSFNILNVFILSLLAKA